MSMSTAQPFRLRSQLYTDNLPAAIEPLARALSDAEHELKVSYYGDMLITWTELALTQDAAHKKGSARLSEAYGRQVTPEVMP